MLQALAPDHDRAHLDAALRYVTNWRRAVDCGAHVGTWASVLSQRFKRVVAIEPWRENFERLELAMPKNVRCINAAVGAEPGEVGMKPGPENTGQYHVAEGVGFPVITVDSLKLDDVGFLKVDVEGWELLALQGAYETIARCKPVVLIEENGLCERYNIGRGLAGMYLESLGARRVAICNKDYIYTFQC